MQISPRAPWTLVGEVLAVNPVTAARRWQRPAEAGPAWVTACPRLADSRIVVTAVVEVDTEPGRAEDVAGALAADPAVPNIKLTAGGRDLVVAVQARGLHELTDRTMTLFRRTPYVRATCTHVSTGIPPRAADGGCAASTRSRAPGSRRRCPRPRCPPPPPGPAGTTWTPGCWNC
ncbi:Lrp/AsnC ligand binding domain-containing protein [Streptomyces adelaidensis]|uniref:Lrp/AsnC ligand binding domain-containing protein n=1 Tax=Streptomyces adelaidensis TaxID=2796465 RepID=UPI001F1E6C8C|nr:Lrp/AsnC ligand binding domain-containing protein [Streptomyces adelaidensis]